MDNWFNSALYGQLPDEDIYDGVVLVQQFTRWYAPPEIRTETYPATKFRIIRAGDKIILRLSPARQLNYGAGHTFAQHYGTIKDGKIYRVWPTCMTSGEKQFEQALADSNQYEIGVHVKSECVQYVPGCDQKICSGCSRAYSCTSAVVLCLDCLLC